MVGEEADRRHAALVAFGDELGPFHSSGGLEEGRITGEDDLNIVCSHDWTCVQNCGIPGIYHCQTDNQPSNVSKCLLGMIDNLTALHILSYSMLSI